MIANPIEPQSMQAEGGASLVDLEALAQGIWRDLHGQVDQEVVRQVLNDLLPKYQEARVFTYIPVLMRRDAIEILRRQS